MVVSRCAVFVCVVPATVLAVYCRLFTPFYAYPQPIFGKADKAHAAPMYMNINLTHEFWKDIRWQRLHAFDGSSTLVYLAFRAILPASYPEYAGFLVRMRF